MKGRLDKRWGQMQNLYYSFNKDTRNKTYSTRKSWHKTTTISLLDISLWICGERCKTPHGPIEEEKYRKKRDNVLVNVQRCFTHNDLVPEEY